MLRIRHLSVVLAASFALTACGPDVLLETGHAEWKERRVQSLRTNWVSLAGLYWISADVSRLGSDPTAEIVFPSDAPPRVGTLYRGAGGFEFEPDGSVRPTVEGAPFSGGEIATDAEGSPTTLSVDSWRFSVIERYGRHAVRLYDDRRRELVSADDLPFYPLSSDWQIRSRFVPHDDPVVILVPTFTGDIQELVSPGTVHFEVDGREASLDVLEGTATQYFIMFHDATNADSTYEAGRYMYVDHEDASGTILLDFNRAYNPPCAFTPYATCPYPPPQNRLSMPVEAGEKRVPETW